MKSYEIANSTVDSNYSNTKQKTKEVNLKPYLLSFGLMVGYTFLSEWNKLVKSKIR